MAGGMEPGDLYGPFQPKPFLDSTVLRHCSRQLAVEDVGVTLRAGIQFRCRLKTELGALPLTQTLTDVL